MIHLIFDLFHFHLYYKLYTTFIAFIQVKNLFEKSINSFPMSSIFKKLLNAIK